MNTPTYRGRFAPSPSGPLHFGSLVAAVASFADARHHGGAWLVRIEDVDQTRSLRGIEEHILNTLAAFGMQSDTTPERQSERTARYDSVLEQLARSGQVYRCNCSRTAVAAIAGTGPEGAIYPGTCRHNPPEAKLPAAWRVLTDAQPLGFADRILGETTQNLAGDIGDFVVKRIDGYTAYQLIAQNRVCASWMTDSTPTQTPGIRRSGLKRAVRSVFTSLARNCFCFSPVVSVGLTFDARIRQAVYD